MCSENEERERDCLCCREVGSIEDEKFTGLFILIFFVASLFSCRQNNVNYKVLNFSLPLCSSQLNYLSLLVFMWRHKIISTLLLVSSFSIFSSPYFFVCSKNVSLIISFSIINSLFGRSYCEKCFDRFAWKINLEQKLTNRYLIFIEKTWQIGKIGKMRCNFQNILVESFFKRKILISCSFFIHTFYSNRFYNQQRCSKPC